ncbi:hypothetical protein D3C80_1547450 [compost metagenome]
MEERVDDQVAVALAQADHFAPVADDAQVLPVGGHHALGLAGGAGGEKQVGEVLFAYIGLARGQLIRRDAIGQVEERLPAITLTTQDDALAQRRQILAVEQRRVVDAEEFADHEQQAGAAFAQDHAGLGTFHPRIQRHQHRTDAL